MSKVATNLHPYQLDSRQLFRGHVRRGTAADIPVESTPLSQQITRWLGDWRQSDDRARDQLFAVVHPQLRQIASRVLHHERGDHSEPNALVNELCVRLLGAEPITFNDRAHFFAVARADDEANPHRSCPRAGGRQTGRRLAAHQLSAVDGWLAQRSLNL